MEDDVIQPTAMYPLNAARKRMGWTTPSSWSEARRRGIGDRIRYFGKRGYLLGQDMIDVVMAEGKHRNFEPSQG